MAVRQSRGWRDPRQLRAARQRGPLNDTAPLQEPDEYSGSLSETLLAEGLADQAPVEVMDASFTATEEIGSSVVTAGANEPAADRREPAGVRGQTSQSWYGIEQAPTNLPVQPKSIAQGNLDEIQMELSAMVAGPEQGWNLAPLAQRTRYFIEHGANSIERGQARLLLERIESFGMMARSAAAVGLSPAPQSTALPASVATNPSSATPARAASWTTTKAAPTAPESAGSASGQFDATGWLVPVHSSGRDMPTHALTNDTGKIIVYVTPAPGVNLSRFESQPIGVYGLRGYLPQLKTNHIQIQRVVRLQ